MGVSLSRWIVSHWNAIKLLKSCRKFKKLLPKFRDTVFSNISTREAFWLYFQKAKKRCSKRKELLKNCRAQGIERQQHSVLAFFFFCPGTGSEMPL